MPSRAKSWQTPRRSDSTSLQRRGDGRGLRVEREVRMNAPDQIRHGLEERASRRERRVCVVRDLVAHRDRRRVEHAVDRVERERVVVARILPRQRVRKRRQGPAAGPSPCCVARTVSSLVRPLHDEERHGVAEVVLMRSGPGPAPARSAGRAAGTPAPEHRAGITRATWCDTDTASLYAYRVVCTTS